MRPPGSNYKNYCSSKLLMSCDVLPTCEEGLGVEKACSPDEGGGEGGSPTGPVPRSHRGGKGSVYPDHKRKLENKTRDRQPGWDSWNRTKIRAFSSPKVSVILALWSCRHAGVTEEHSSDAGPGEGQSFLLRLGNYSRHAGPSKSGGSALTTEVQLRLTL